MYEHESKCAHLHGHNYVALFHARAEQSPSQLDKLGRVIDFSVLKDRIGGWIDLHWDHGFILFDRDPVSTSPVFNGMKTYALPLNPTAENLAFYLLYKVCPEALQGTGVEVVKVELWETENCKAEVELERDNEPGFSPDSLTSSTKKD